VNATLIAALGFALIAFGIVAWPLIQPGRRVVPRTDDTLDELRRKRDTIYESLRELDFDQRTGKISEADYAELAESYKRQAITLLKQLDDQTRDAILAIDREIEEEVATRRTTTVRRAGPRCVACGASIDASDRFCRTCGVPREKSCPKCSASVGTGDQFCPRCGAGL
jgi:hypothetical protein